MTPATFLLPQLYAIRVMLDGMIGSLEQEIAAATPMEDEGGCGHPAERQVNATRMGGLPMVLCLVCGRERRGTAPGGA